MAALEPDVEFFGIRIPPNATVSFGDKDRRDDSPSSSSGGSDGENGINGGDDDDGDAMLVDGVALVHATQVALGPNPSPGRHTVMAVRSLGGTGKGRAFPIGTLEVGKTEQFSIDLMWSMLDANDGGGGAGGRRIDGGCGDVSFMHTGQSDVYITGYKTVTSLLDDERGYSGGEEDEEDEDFSSSDEEEESDEEEAPLGVPLQQQRQKLEQLKQRRAAAKEGAQFSSSSSGDDDSESDGEEYDSEDEEDPNASRRAYLAASRAAQPQTPATGKRPLCGESESESDSDDESDSDSDSDADSEDDEEPLPASKKAKTQGDESAESASYAAALKDFIKQHGPTKLGSLGSAVKRPTSLPKLSTFLTGRGDFRVDGEQRVSVLP